MIHDWKNRSGRQLSTYENVVNESIFLELELQNLRGSDGFRVRGACGTAHYRSQKLLAERQDQLMCIYVKRAV